MKLFSYLTLLPSLIRSAAGNQQQSFFEVECDHPKYNIHIYSHSPLVIYISNFLSPEERLHLQEISKDKFTDSAIADEAGTQRKDQVRTSQSTSLPSDPIVDCITQRARFFQDLNIPASHVEPLQLVQYTQNQSYSYHTDWFISPSQTTPKYGGNRISSFFVYVVNEDVTGGGTNFPMLDSKTDDNWCWYLDCDQAWEKGATFRPMAGNAVFWRNVDEDGRGDDRVLHKGEPLTSGRKVGMNIWTREGSLSEEFRAGTLKVDEE